MHELLDILPAELRARALTHPAFAPSRAESFERLEFLGDSVLGLVITQAIFERHGDLPEGELSKVRAATVSRDSCAQVAQAAGLGERMVEQALHSGAAFEASARQLSTQRNALAALTESVIGAAFLAHGFDVVAPLVLDAFEARIAYALEHRVDARSRLQELAAAAGTDVAFTELGAEGPAHDRRFTVQVQLAGVARARTPLAATGTGRSKQEAQQAAAAAMLALMDRDQG